MLLVYVDDIVLTSDNLATIINIKAFLTDHLKIKDLGELCYFLGMEVIHALKGLYINQKKYALELLRHICFLGSKPVTSPMSSNLKLISTISVLLDDTPNLESYENCLLGTNEKITSSTYHKLISCLLYLTNTHLDISLVV